VRTKYKPLGDLLFDLLHECGQHDVSLSSCTVLTAMALTADIDGTTNVSLRGVARHLNLSVSTIRRHMAQLVELGFVESLGADPTDNRRQVWRIPAMDQCDDGQVLGLPVDPVEVDGASGAVS